MMRVSNWEQALSDYLFERSDMPFEYGKNDCCTFAAGAVQAMTGINPMEEFVGKYKSMASSVRAISNSGFDGLEQIMDSKFDSIPIGFASTGDLAFFNESVGVVVGGKAAFVSEDGFVLISREKWDKAWGVARG